MRLVLLLVLIVLLLGALPTWPYSTGWGYYPSGGLWTGLDCAFGARAVGTYLKHRVARLQSCMETMGSNA
jgi:hypothetical protein